MPSQTHKQKHTPPFLLRQQKRHGFTLVELLVVIAIISVLVSLLLPALSSVRGQALQIQCTSQMRQLGVATESYLSDEEGYLPFAFHTVETTFSGYATKSAPAWYVLLAPYLDVPTRPASDAFGFYQLGVSWALRPTKPLVFTCPSHEITYPNAAPISYAPEIGLTSASYVSTVNNQRRPTLSRIHKQSTKAWLSEWDSATGTGIATVLNASLFVLGNANMRLGERHRGSSEILFFDNHVQWLPISELLAPSLGNVTPGGLYDPYK